MKRTTSTSLAEKIIAAHGSRQIFDCSILDSHVVGLTVRNEFGRVEVRRFIKIPSVRRLANLLEITYS